MPNVNITEVRLLSVPLENDYKHTIYFDGSTAQEKRQAQETYFKSKTVHTLGGGIYSYQRKDNVIRCEKHIDTLYNCNYVMYKNKAYSNRWFYAFITDMVYKNDECTEIHIETDVMQTWLTDIDVLPSFIEREHVDDDTVGLHTQPEQLETGEYICAGITQSRDLLNCVYVLSCSIKLQDMKNDDVHMTGGGQFNNIYSGLTYYIFDDADHRANEGNANGGVVGLSFILSYLDQEGKADCVNAIFLAPKELLTLSDLNSFRYADGDLPVLFRTVTYSNSANEIEWFGGFKPTAIGGEINGYTPLNNKLLTYPYCYLMMSNHNGGNAIYRYEHFVPDVWNDEDTGTVIERCKFKIYGAITPGFSMRVVPERYKGLGLNYEEGLTGGKFPVCNWSSDIYTNWLTQNSVNNAVSIGAGAIQIGMGAGAMASSSALSATVLGTATASGGLPVMGGMAILSGVTAIAGKLGEIYQHSLVPPQSKGNLNSGDVCFSSQNNLFTSYSMSIKREYAKVIDDYFSMFGYAINRVKRPNKNHRKHFWFTKTVSANIDGAIPNKDLQKIKNVYDNGVTFWRSDTDIGNYSLQEDNAII